MLEHVNHPFICNLRYSFQDIEYMYDCLLEMLNPKIPLGFWSNIILAGISWSI